MKRAYSLIVCVAVVAAVSACGGGGGSSDAVTATGPIKIWLSDNALEISWGEALVKQWNKENPKQKVTAQEIPAGESSEAVIQASITAGNAPCLIWNVAPAAVPQFQRAGGLVPLDSFDGGVQYARERTGGLVDQYVSSDGQLYQLPWKSNPVMIIYNKALFEEAGLDPENPSLATYDEFRQTAETLNSELDIAAIWPSADQTFFQAWFDYYPTFIAATGGDQLVQNGKAQFDSETGVEVGEFWRSMYEDGLIPQESAQVDAFAEEQSAMSIVGPWAVAVYKDLDWGVVPVPTPDGTPPDDVYTFSDAKNVSIFSACKNQKTAFDFMKFATSEESDRALLEESGQMPLRTGIEEKYADYFEENPLYAEFAEQSSRTVEVPNVPNSIEMWENFRGAYSTSVIFGRKPVPNAFSTSAKEVEELVKEGG
ncbi:MAG: extracellular solute-binding protein [Rubrobacter sp.]|nr:extracellular solute-binding protein [Rubrobacter sp.]